MNTYFDHSSAGFYNPSHQAVAAEAHQAAYRSFALMPPSAPSAYQNSRPNSTSAPSDSTSNYVDSACKLYDSPSTQNSAFKASECVLSKEQNGFKAPGIEQMTSTSVWNSPLRPSPSSMSMAGDPMRSFDAAAAAAAWCYPPYHVPHHSQTRPDTSSYLSSQDGDGHRGGFADAYGVGSSRLPFAGDGVSSNGGVYHPHQSAGSAVVSQTTPSGKCCVFLSDVALHLSHKTSK